MGLDELTKHDHSSDTQGGVDLDVANKLDVPTFSNDANVPNGSFFFNDQDNDFKFKDLNGNVVTVTDQVAPAEIDVTGLSVGSLGDGQFLQNSGGSLTGGSPGGETTNDLYGVAQWMLASGGYYGGVYPGSTLSGDVTGTVTGQGTQIASFSVSGNPEGVGVDPADGTLWNSDSTGGNIRHFQRDGTLITSFGTPVGGHSQGVSVDPTDGTLWHADTFGAVYHLQRDGTQIASFAPPDGNPRGISIDPADGKLWLADATASTETIYHLQRDGTVIDSFSSPGGDPRGMAVDPADGTLWNANSGSNVIFHIERDGTQIESFNSPAGTATGLGIDPADGSLWNASTFNDNIFHVNRFSGTADLVEYAGETFVRQRRPSDPLPKWGRDRFFRQPVATSATTLSRQSVIQPVDTSGGAVTITLASSIVADGAWVTISDEAGSAGSNNITIDTEGSETIDGSSSASIGTNFGSKMFYSDGTNWFEA